MEVKHSGKALLALRKRFNYSQKDMAFYLGLHQSQYSLIENEKRGFTLKTFLKLREAVSMNAHDLLKELEILKEERKEDGEAKA